MKAYILPIALFGFALGVGFKSVQYSWDGVSYYNVENISSQRDPAAFHNVFDYSHLEGEALQFASKSRLLEGASLVSSDGDPSVQLGHFVVRGEGQEKRFACQSYDKVHLEFAAEGFMVNGEQTSLEVQTNCSVTANVNFIDPVRIPFSDLFKEKPGNGEFSFYGDRSIHVKVARVGEEWPKRWYLKSVKLMNSDSFKELEVHTKDLPKKRAQEFHFLVE